MPASASLHIRVRYMRDAKNLYADGLAYATPGSVGLDLRACFLNAPNVEEELVIQPGARAAIPAGIAVEPSADAVAGFVYSRSGLGALQGLIVAQGVGVIDPDYRGEITVVLLNTADEERRVRRGDRIAQLVFQPVFRVRVEEAVELGATARGEGGFGHTGQ